MAKLRHEPVVFVRDGDGCSRIYGPSPRSGVFVEVLLLREGGDFLYFKHSRDLIWEEGELLLSEPPSTVCISGGITQNPLNSPRRSIRSLCQEGIPDPSHARHHLPASQGPGSTKPTRNWGKCGSFWCRRRCHGNS